MKILVSMVSMFAVLAGFAGWAVADQRSLTRVYEYSTLARGKAELEHYLTFSAPSGGFGGQSAVEHQVELEIGMNDRFDVGIYQVFVQTPGAGLGYEEMKLRGRYRFAEKGAWPVDTLVYLEGVNSADSSKQEIEAKVILAHDFGAILVSVNPIFEAAKTAEWETEPGYAVGLAWKPLALLSIGAEAYGNPDVHYAGPVLAHGGSEFWMALGLAMRHTGTDEHGPKTAIRLVSGWAF